jgi:hypothetical protein
LRGRIVANDEYCAEQDVHAPCSGVRKLMVDGNAESFEHTSLTIDEDRHLRLVVYARQQDGAAPFS